LHKTQKTIGYSRKIDDITHRVDKLETQLETILHLIKLNRMMIKKIANKEPRGKQK
jgi:hypothetical protein